MLPFFKQIIQLQALVEAFGDYSHWGSWRGQTGSAVGGTSRARCQLVTALVQRQMNS